MMTRTISPVAFGFALLNVGISCIGGAEPTQNVSEVKVDLDENAGGVAVDRV